MGNLLRGAGFGQGSKRERRIAVLDFLLKYYLQSGCGQAAPASPGEAGAGLSRQPLGLTILKTNNKNHLQAIVRIWNNPISVLMQWELDLEMLQTNGFVIAEVISISIKRAYKTNTRSNGYWITSNNLALKGIR
jgi:hypothetical protein